MNRVSSVDSFLGNQHCLTLWCLLRRIQNWVALLACRVVRILGKIILKINCIPGNQYPLIYHISICYTQVTLASYQIRIIAGCACAGNAGNVFPRRRFQRKLLVSDPGMHQGTCVTHVPWCMRDRLPAVTGKTFPAFPAHAHPQFCASGKRPM